MEAQFLLDTNICIYIRRKKPEQVLRRFTSLRHGQAVLSVITFGELIYGAEKSLHRSEALKQLQELAELLPVMALPEAAAREFRRVGGLKIQNWAL